MKVVVGPYAMAVEFHGMSTKDLEAITADMWRAVQTALVTWPTSERQSKSPGYTIEAEKTSDLMDELRDHLAEQASQTPQ